MDLLDILRSRVDKLPEGDYTKGLKAVVQHIEVAERHFERGKAAIDDTAFTDAIYRTNQAFEGSLKEAFRVLAGKDPSNQRTFDIENYLQRENILRSRVLAQLKNYRQEWRNPSTHDYRLDFDEDESLLAIVSVSAFAIMLVDQITERISFEQAKAVAATQIALQPSSSSLVEQISTLIEQFIAQFSQTHVGRDDVREVEITGALAGFLASAAPHISAQLEGKLRPDRYERPDLLLTSTNEQLILEVKRSRLSSRRMMEEAIQQVSNYMTVGNINQAILFIFSGVQGDKVTRSERLLPTINGRIVIISTEDDK